ncbi:MAG TPA: SgcJ/EcaC family oxidoreductase [Stellaceae bacterium]|jgi:uncharacterized protein (TIGR02246 family)|nr:SgcJ/EcaC family oxidoreductase [Stellaceae bacterium]HXS40755.1 SgcJ/EcaC family oxidoreductase [Stellaceae bacterium]
MSVQRSSEFSASGERLEDRAAIAAVAHAFDTAWNRHDLVAFAALFAPDADFVNVVGMWWKNRAEIEAAHVYSHASFFRDSALSGRIEKVRFIARDIAAAHILWELKGQIEPDGSIGKPRHGILLLVVVRREGRWLIQVAQNTDIIAGALTQPGEGESPQFASTGR